MNKLSIFLLACILSSASLFGQKTATFTTAIIVENDEEKGIKEATGKLYQGSKEISTVTTTSEGVVTFKLEPNSEYTIVISKDGYVSKTVHIDTKIPKYEDQNFEVAFPVLLFVPCEGLDYSVLKNPVVKLVYDDLRRDFFPEKVYDNTMRAKLEQLYKDNDKCLEEKFNKVVREADRLFAQKTYIESREKYVEAQKMRPDNEHVNDRIAEIDKILSEQKDSDKLYKDYISTADKNFTDKRLPLSKEYYKRASALKPNEQYPKDRIAEIDKLLAKQAKEEQDKATQQAQQNQAQQATESKYQQSITQGNDIYASDPCAALESYKVALSAKPSDPTAQQRVNDADRRCKEKSAQSAQAQEAQNKYNAALAKADELFKAGKYADAKKAYQEAAALKPNAAYPLDQIDLIDKEIKKQAKASDNLFQDLMDAGNAALDKQQYAVAKDNFQKALNAKPNDPFAQKQVSLVEKLMAEKIQKDAASKANKDSYDKIIAEADRLYKAKDFVKAKAEYLKAQQLMPDEKYATDKLDELDYMAKEEDKSKDKKYRELIDAADKAFESENYVFSKEQYQNALLVKPGEQYPKDRISLLSKLIADQQKNQATLKAKKDLYDKAILEADKLLAAKNYTEARSKYFSAQQILPTEKYPVQKMGEIDDILAAQTKDKEQQYKNYISAGDDALKDENLTMAKDQFEKASALKPGEQYPKDKVVAINKLIADKQKNDADRKAKQDLYDKAIADADKFFNAGDLTSSRASYVNAQTILPTQGYPAQRIKEIDALGKAKDKEKELQYKKLISEADKAFDAENMTLAKDNYQKAQTLKPDEAYPKEKLKDIDGLLAEKQKIEAEKKAKQDLFNKAIADADLAFKKPDFANAKAGYIKALQILPYEEYPKQKLTEIEAIEKEKSDKIERDYSAKIQSGDKNFATRNLTQAKQDYQDALKIKAGEQYPTSRLADIDKLIAEQAKAAADDKAKQDAYNAAVAKADNALKAQQYDLAIASYKEASTIKPGEQYPFTKIDEITQIKKKLELEANYKKAIASGDLAFGQKQFEQAKSAYNQALTVKPADAYATAQIAKADKEIADQLQRLADSKSRQEAYDKNIAEADKFLLAKDYDMAKTLYQKASQIMADKPYPKQKITEIENILKEKRRNDDYRELVDEATAQYNAKNYLQAKDKYKAAAVVKPEEAFPGEKIKEIDKILAQLDADKQKLAQNEKNFNDAISRANDLFDKASYDASKKEYENALSYMPNESFPKQRIAKINEIKAMLAKSDKAQSDSKTVAKPSAIKELKFKNDNEREAYLKELLTKYPAGISCEVYKESNRTITRYVIIRDNQANDYREVRHNWGGVDYIKNDKPVTQLYFATQVKTRSGEAFNKSGE